MPNNTVNVAAYRQAAIDLLDTLLLIYDDELHAGGDRTLATARAIIDTLQDEHATRFGDRCILWGIDDALEYILHTSYLESPIDTLIQRCERVLTARYGVPLYITIYQDGCTLWARNGNGKRIEGDRLTYPCSGDQLDTQAAYLARWA